jgi:hypothetical protein
VSLGISPVVLSPGKYLSYFGLPVRVGEKSSAFSKNRCLGGISEGQVRAEEVLQLVSFPGRVLPAGYKSLNATDWWIGPCSAEKVFRNKVVAPRGPCGIESVFGTETASRFEAGNFRPDESSEVLIGFSGKVGSNRVYLERF